MSKNHLMDSTFILSFFFHLKHLFLIVNAENTQLDPLLTSRSLFYLAFFVDGVISMIQVTCFQVSWEQE